MSDTLQQLLRATATVPLDDLLYPEGSRVVGIVNPTRAWRRQWNEQVVGRRDDDADEKQDVDEKRVEASWPLIPYVIDRVVIVDDAGDEHTFDIETAEDAREVDDIDPRIFNMAVNELLVRGNEGVLDAHRTFRRTREQRLARAGQVRAAGSGAASNSDAPAE